MIFFYFVHNRKERANIISPSQLDPDPSYPVLHVHSKEPSVLVHSALSSQLSVPFSHSSISVEVDKLDNKYAFPSLF